MTDQKLEIKKKLHEIFSSVLERDIDFGELDVESGILEKFHIDSLIALQIIVRIEQDFGIVIEDDNVAVEILDSFNKAVEFISENQQVHEMR
ncbi:acyl carrier protein [Acetivibrio mesophilus]|uniref:Carrier domain-containing protein n=1 Tax=Acetivibrio mesophilus TaxID=2487273 RepID=A0A4Q0I8I4_9FIRM|nr:phosphopantetheine-binding protein [Acetivibrio mesophilus]ODM26239.1 hypothetical protein A7W90_08380 [Clostridium sp. Bc-iso-3]RXE60708.1 hypothetical protein EFD62_01960 [Acetivibrio mesophilus]HHV28121.1 hypothetical protein [Clostridium sp.]